MAKTRKRARLFASIEKREDALLMINDTAIGFFLMAVLQIGIGLWTEADLVIDSLLYVILAGVLYKWRSRVAALLLLLLSGTGLVMALLNTFGMTEVTTGVGTNIVLAILLFWVAIRAVEATFKLYGEYAAPQTVDEEAGPPGS